MTLRLVRSTEAMIGLPPYITIDNPNPGRYGNWKHMKAGLTIRYIPEAYSSNRWFASYGTAGEIGIVLSTTGRTREQALTKLKSELRVTK